MSWGSQHVLSFGVWTSTERLCVQPHQAFGCPSDTRGFLKWWHPQNTREWSFLVGKPMVVWYHHLRKRPHRDFLQTHTHRVRLNMSAGRNLKGSRSTGFTEFYLTETSRRDCSKYVIIVLPMAHSQGGPSKCPSPPPEWGWEMMEREGQTLNNVSDISVLQQKSTKYATALQQYNTDKVESSWPSSNSDARIIHFWYHHTTKVLFWRSLNMRYPVHENNIPSKLV